jgi:putative redox protein
MTARTSTKISFPNPQGEMLSGILDAPTGTPRLYGVFGPCFTCVKESHAAAKTCRALAEDGIAMLRFDTTGVGASAGDAAAGTFSGRIGDLLSAARYLAENHEAPKLLVGHSISGTAALSAVLQLPTIEALATIGSPADTQATLGKFRSNGDIRETAEGADINVLGTTFHFGKEFVPDMEAQDVAADTAKITCKVFVFHAPNDAIVAYKNADAIAARARNAEIVTLDREATHLFENRNDDALFVARTLSAWFATRG